MCAGLLSGRGDFLEEVFRSWIQDKWHNPARTQEGRPGVAWGGASGRREREEVGMGSMLDPGAVGTEWAA